MRWLDRRLWVVWCGVNSIHPRPSCVWRGHAAFCEPTSEKPDMGHPGILRRGILRKKQVSPLRPPKARTPVEMTILWEGKGAIHGRGNGDIVAAR